MGAEPKRGLADTRSPAARGPIGKTDGDEERAGAQPGGWSIGDELKTGQLIFSTPAIALPAAARYRRRMTVVGSRGYARGAGQGGVPDQARA